MDNEKNKHADPKPQIIGVPEGDGGTAQSMLDRGVEAYGQAEKAVSDAYDNTAQAVGETYEHAKSYSRKNPERAILIALGIGIGLGFLLGASYRPTRTGRFARPVVHALSDFAFSFLR